MTTTKCILFTSAVLAVLLPQCSIDSTTSTDGNDGSFTRTIVHLSGDTIVSYYTTSITAADKRAGEVYRHAGLTPSANITTQTVLADASCVNSDMWLFDQENEGGNELCLYADTLPSTGNLAFFFKFPRQPYNWVGQIRSWWAGNQAGYFYEFCANCLHNSACNGNMLSRFQASTQTGGPYRCDIVNQCTSLADRITFADQNIGTDCVSGAVVSKP